MIPGISSRSGLQLLALDLAEVLFERLRADDLLEGSGVAIEGLTPQGDLIRFGFMQASGDHGAVAGFNMNVVSEPARLAPAGGDVGAHVWLGGGLFFRETQG